MNAREKILAVAIVALLGLFGLRSIHGRIGENYTQKQAILSSVQTKLDSVLDGLESSDRAEAKLCTWRARSLPHDEDIARSLYQHWVVNQFALAGLTNIDVRTQLAAASARSTYGTLTVTLTADGSLDSLTDFLFAFYQADDLHKIRSLTASPSPTGDRLDLTMVIEALILPDADNRNRLPKGTANRLALDRATAYEEAIVGRNLFAAYKPPPKPKPKPPVVVREKPKPKPPFDDATQAYVTGIVGQDGQFEVWITVRTTDESLRLSTGEPFDIGLMSGHIADITPRAVLLETDDGPIRVDFGHNLREGDLVDVDVEM